MNPLLEIDWSAWLEQASLKATFLLLVALLVVRGLKHASAAVRHMVWASAVAGVLVVALASALLPSWRVPLLPAALPAVLAGPEIAAPATAGVADRAELRRSVEEIGALGEASAVRAAPVAAAHAPTQPGSASWFLGVWGLGASLILLRLLLGAARLGWLRRRSTMITDPAWLGEAHALAERLGLNRGVTLLRGPRGAVPMTWGVLQPVIRLPADGDEWCSERRSLVLAHELAHVRRRDALTHWIAQLALALHWFNPLVWHAIRRLREERERACDDVVLSLGTRASTYAGHLLDIVRTLGSGPGPAPAMAMARRSQLEARLVALLDRRARRGATSPRASAVAGVLTLSALLPLAALSPVRAEAERSAASGLSRAGATPAPTPNAAAGGLVEQRAAPSEIPDAPGSPLPTYGASADERNLLTWNDAAGHAAELHTLGRIEFSADGTEIRRISRGGYLRLQARGPSGERGVEVRSRDGEPRYAFSMNGAPAAGDAAARDWLAPVNAYLAFRAADEQRTNVYAERARVLEAAARVVAQTRSSAPDAVGSPRGAPRVRADTLPSRVRGEAHAARDRRARSGVHRLTGTHHGRPSFELSIDMRDVVLTADRTGVAEVLAGGVLVVDEERFAGHPDTDTPIVRRLRITPAPGGELRYDYRVDGVSRAFDAEARAWLATLLRRHLN